MSCSFITARKRSVGQGNIFTGICLSTGGGGLLDRDRDPPDRDHRTETPWTETPLDKDPLDRDPRTETSSLDRDPPYGKERAVRILLECILVLLFFSI